MEELHRMLKRATTPTLKMYATTVWQCIHTYAPHDEGHVGRSLSSGTLKVLLAMSTS